MREKKSVPLQTINGKANMMALSPQEVLRSLVKRYVAAMIRDAKTEEGLTEENFKVNPGFSLPPA